MIQASQDYSPPFPPPESTEKGLEEVRKLKDRVSSPRVSEGLPAKSEAFSEHYTHCLLGLFTVQPVFTSHY